MKFYQILSKFYDDIFPAHEETLNFLSQSLEPHSRILDIACATGNYLLPFAEKGHDTDGIDIDEDMVEIAKIKTKGFSANIVCGDMSCIKQIFGDRKYDLIFCIGNSIVHLNNKIKIQALIRDIYSLLDEHGQIVIQIINYDRIIEQKIHSLPTIENRDKKLKFIRNYYFKEESCKVIFNTRLIVQRNSKDDEEYDNSIELIALRAEELLDMAKNAGFESIEIFGGFDMKPYSINSLLTVLRARK